MNEFDAPAHGATSRRQSGRFNPGTAFKNGKLLVFENYSLTVMKPWPAPLAWRRTTRRPFRPHRPAIPLIEEPPGSACEPWIERRHRLMGDFMAPVPARSRTAIAQFTERQWHVMSLLARCPGADDLIESTPALAFALASNWVFAKRQVAQPMRAARSLVRKKQVAICDWLDLPPRDSTVNLLRKLRPDSIGIRTLLDLRDVMWHADAVKLLRHCWRINSLAVRIAATPWRRAHLVPGFSPNLAAWWKAARNTRMCSM